MKKEEKQTKKTKDEKPILTKFKKLTDVVAGGATNGAAPGLGCMRFQEESVKKETKIEYKKPVLVNHGTLTEAISGFLKTVGDPD